MEFSRTFLQALQFRPSGLISCVTQLNFDYYLFLFRSRTEQ